MALKNMRNNGAAALEAWCGWRHRAVVDVAGWRETIKVPTARMRRRCSAGGKRPERVAPM